MNLRSKSVNKPKNVSSKSKKVLKVTNKSVVSKEAVEEAPKMQTRRSQLNIEQKIDQKVKNKASPGPMNNGKLPDEKKIQKTRTGRQLNRSDEKIKKTNTEKSIIEKDLRRSKRVLNDSIVRNSDNVNNKTVKLTPNRLSLMEKPKTKQKLTKSSELSKITTRKVNKKQPFSIRTNQSPKKLIKSPEKSIQHAETKQKSVGEPKIERKTTRSSSLVKSCKEEPSSEEKTLSRSLESKSDTEKNNKTKHSYKIAEKSSQPVNLPVKHVPAVKNSLSTIKTRQLRNKNPQNYFEDTVNSTNNSETSQTSNEDNKVPVYKKLPKNDEPKNGKDPYEFDVPTIEKKTEKRKLNDSSKYDKKMHEIMQNIIRKMEKQKKTVQKKRTNTKSSKMKPKGKEMEPEKSPNDLTTRNDQIEPISLHAEHISKESNKKIMILNDHKLNKPLDTPKNFKNPNANSTFVDNVSCSPWRFPSEMIIYNPHFIKLKDTALPSINQEPIIDYKLEEVRKSHKTPPERQQIRKSPVQKSILNYLKVSSNFESQIPNRTNLSYSLYDADQLSPIKGHPSVELKDTVKRNILTDSNKQNPMENRTNLFGFDESNTEINEGNKENTTSSPIKRPFRYEIKQYKKKTVETPVEVERNEDEMVPDDSFETETVENEPIELFEDPENMFKETGVNVERKRRRPRYLSTASEGEEAPRKKKKDVFTKEEEEAFNKWVEQFNSMCEEVDKHVLEIE